VDFTRRRPRLAPETRSPVTLPDPRQTLFLDESGNAGPNYLDREQPFHTEGGILVPDHVLPAVRDAVARALSKIPGQEFKAARLLDSNRWTRVIADMLEGVLALDGVVVIFATAERRYALAGRVVETLLDPDTNPSAAFLPWWAHDLRERAWMAVAELDDAVLEQFAAAYRSLDRGALVSAAVALAEAMDRNRFGQLAVACRASVACIDDILGLENLWVVRKGFKHGQVSALNAPMCMHATKQADRILDSMNPRGDLHLVHDRVDWFADVFEVASATLLGDTGMPLEMPRLEGPTLRMGLRRLKSCSVADSKVEHCLQVADVVASSVSKILRGCITGGMTWSTELARIARWTIGLLYEDENPHGTIIASPKAKQKIDEELARAGVIAASSR
jgi:hypothetical protein